LSVAQGVGFDLVTVEASVGDGHGLVFAKPSIRRRQSRGPDGNRDLVEVARIVEARVAHEVLVVAIFFRISAGKAQHGCERRRLQLSQRCHIYISNHRRARWKLAHDVRLGASARWRKRAVQAVKIDARTCCGQADHHSHHNPSALCTGDGHIAVILCFRI
jgi:hypothetical protein